MGIHSPRNKATKGQLPKATHKERLSRKWRIASIIIEGNAKETKK